MSRRYLRYATGDATWCMSSRDGSVVLDLDSRYRVNSAIALLDAVMGGAGIESG